MEIKVFIDDLNRLEENNKSLNHIELMKFIKRIENFNGTHPDSMLDDIKYSHHVEPDSVIIILASEEGKFSDIIYYYSTEHRDVILRKITTDTININSTVQDIINFVYTSDMDLIQSAKADNKLEELNNLYENSYIWDYFETNDHTITIERGFSFLETEEVFINRMSSKLGIHDDDVRIYSDGVITVYNSHEYSIKKEYN
jgi:hypothetical protein